MEAKKFYTLEEIEDKSVSYTHLETLTRSASDGGIPKSVVESFPTIGTADVNLIDKVIHFNPCLLYTSRCV